MKLLPRVSLPTQHPYLSNKYTQWYYNIISHAINRGKIDVYTEKHHIIPRSMGGTDRKTNLARLTAREHCLVHLLLVRMTEKENHYKMVTAIWYMLHSYKTDDSYRLNSRVFQKIREIHSSIQRERQKLRRASDETRAKQSAAHKGRVKSPEHLANLAASQKGKKLSPEAIAKRTATRRANGNYAHSEEHKNKLRGRKQSPELIAKRIAPLIGQKHSPERVEKRRQALLGRKLSEEHKEKIRAAHMGKSRTPESIAKGRATKAANRLAKE